MLTYKEIPSAIHNSTIIPVFIIDLQGDFLYMSCVNALISQETLHQIA
jgi:hypothetical protein